MSGDDPPASDEMHTQVPIPAVCLLVDCLALVEGAYTQKMISDLSTHDAADALKEKKQAISVQAIYCKHTSITRPGPLRKRAK